MNPTTVAPTPANQIVTQRPLVSRTPAVGGRGQLTNSSTTLYTAPSPTAAPTGSVSTAVLTSIVFCNTDTVARTVTLYLIESGGSVADNRAVLKDASIAAKTTWTWDVGGDGIPLDDGETIRGLADTTLKVTYRINVAQLVPLP